MGAVSRSNGGERSAGVVSGSCSKQERSVGANSGSGQWEHGERERSVGATWEGSRQDTIGRAASMVRCVPPHSQLLRRRCERGYEAGRTIRDGEKEVAVGRVADAIHKVGVQRGLRLVLEGRAFVKVDLHKRSVMHSRELRHKREGAVRHSAPGAPIELHRLPRARSTPRTNPEVCIYRRMLPASPPPPPPLR